jgi:hypothetical protein
LKVIKDEVDEFEEKLAKIIQIFLSRKPDPFPDSDP